MLEFHINTTSQHVDELSDTLHLLGAAAVTWLDAGDQPIYEPLPGEIIQWQAIIITALFEDDSLAEKLTTFFKFQQTQQLLTSFKMQTVPAQDWVRASLDQFEAICFGKRLWICPSWKTPPEPKAVNVLLDPGLAFGTGTHPTTAMCLQWLDANIKNGEMVLDYGCGSGILAIAALKLGAAHAVGVDYDPQALEACLLNAELNAISSTQLQVQSPAVFDEGTQQYDVLLANILAKPLMELAPKFAHLVKSQGHVVLSGILTAQAAEVVAVYQTYFSFVAQANTDEWVCLHFKKQSEPR